MRRDSFKNVRFGSIGSTRTSSKSSSPKTVVQNTPPSNPYKDIQQALPTLSYYFNHDALVVWIFILAIFHTLGQVYLIFGERFHWWDYLLILASISCTVNECLILIWKDNSENFRAKKYSWRDIISRSKMIILFNCILCICVAFSLSSVYSQQNLLRGLISIVLFNFTVMIRTLDHSNNREFSKSTLSTKYRQFRVDDSEKSILSSIFGHFVSSLWKTFKFSFYATIIPVIALLFDERFLFYSEADLFLHGILVFQLILPFALLYEVEPHRLSWILRIKSLESQYRRKNPGLTLSGSLKYLATYFDLEMRYLKYFKGKHSVLSVFCLVTFLFWLVVEVSWFYLTKRKRIRVLLLTAALLHVIIINLFRFLYDSSPDFIRKNSENPNNTNHSISSHQHPIINESDRNLKVILSQLFTPEQIKERSDDYRRRMEELQNSSNVQFVLRRSQQQQQQQQQQQRHSPPPTAEGFILPEADNKLHKNSNIITVKNTNLKSQTQHAPTSHIPQQDLQSVPSNTVLSRTNSKRKES